MAKKWKDLKKTAEQNAKFLDEQPEEFLNNEVKDAEQKLFSDLALMIDDLETENGRIKKTNKNFLLSIGGIDKVWNGFLIASGSLLIVSLINRLQKVVSNNFNYYSKMLGNSSLFAETRNSIIKLLNIRLGIKESGEMAKDGFVENLYNDKSIRNTAKEIVFKGVLSQNKPEEVKATLLNYVLGDKNKKGAIHAFYSKFAYDSFSQVDRMASVEFATKHNLKWFIYAGIIIKNSRAFCRKKINGVYSIEEAQKWIYENPSPVGISTTTYNPIIEMGGVNCKHLPLFISDEIKEDYTKNDY